LVKQFHPAFHEWSEEVEPVGAIFYGSSIAVEVVLGFTNTFVCGAIPKLILGLQPEPVSEPFLELFRRGLESFSRIHGGTRPCIYVVLLIQILFLLFLFGNLSHSSTGFFPSPFSSWVSPPFFQMDHLCSYLHDYISDNIYFGSDSI
jgi:hypothetical protein